MNIKRASYFLITLILSLTYMAVLRNPVYAANECIDTTVTLFGRPNCTTYFNGQSEPDSGIGRAATFPGGFSTSCSGGARCNDDATGVGTKAQSFIDYISRNIHRCDDSTGHFNSIADCIPFPYDTRTPEQSYWVAVGSAVIVDSMMGKLGTDYTVGTGDARVKTGIVDAQNLFPSWVTLVNSYTSANRADWDLWIPGPSVATPGGVLANCNPNSSGQFTGRTDTLGSKYSGYWDIWYRCVDYGDTHPFIVFTNPDGSVYRIDLDCGNITGPVTSLGVSVGTYNNAPKADVDINDPTNPTNATFHSWVDTGIVGASQEINVTVTRRFYTEKAVTGVQTPVPGTPPPVTGLGNGLNQQRVDVTLGVGGLGPGDKICSETKVSHGSGDIDAAGNVLNGTSITVFKCATLSVKPYLGIFGGDVYAGGGFGSGCTSTQGMIDTAVSGSPLRGSGSQLAAFALGDIKGFNSAQLRGVSAPLPPDGLSFANDAVPNTGNFGANHCITSHYPFPAAATDIPGVISTGDPNLPIDIQYMGSGTYYFEPTFGTQLVYSDLNNKIQDRTRITLYIKGDIVICGCKDYSDGYSLGYNGNIEYEGNWDKPEDIPSVTFIASGNIYINDSVTRLDGTYMAFPNGAGTGGTINTCVHFEYGVYPSFTFNKYGAATLADATYQANCNKQLVVNGALVAKHIDWLRTFGNTSEAAGALQHPYIGGAPLRAAEVIINGPETYMLDRGNGISGSNFDYFTSLPPVL